MKPMTSKSDSVIQDQYVVSLSRESKCKSSVQEILVKYTGIKILEILDRNTALVSAASREVEQVSKEHPELIFEPNSYYTKLRA